MDTRAKLEYDEAYLKYAVILSKPSRGCKREEAEAEEQNVSFCS